VQWDGTGVLTTWIDPTSETAFDSMARCVVDQYSGYQPLPNFNISGVQTQGENIADNGGIQAAYKAFQAYRELYGPDPVLPDGVYQYYSHDQLFFLSFAQAWCQTPDSPKGVEHQL